MKNDIELSKIEREIKITSSDIELNGILGLPQQAKGIIVFAHGSGSGRFSPRNHFVAEYLQQGGFATLLMDLLTEEETLNRKNVFDIPLLANRLNIAKDWIIQQQFNLKIGYFGASTGAGAALVAASRAPKDIFAVVSRGGRPDLALESLEEVKAPTLLIVGGDDREVIELNQIALKKLCCIKELKIVQGATHLFEEPGTLEQVCTLALEWFSLN